MTVKQLHTNKRRVAKYYKYWNCFATIKITMTTTNKTFDLIHFSCVYYVNSCNWHPRPTPPANYSCMPSPVSPHHLLSLSSFSFLLVDPCVTLNIKFIFLQYFWTVSYHFCSYFLPSLFFFSFYTDMKHNNCSSKQILIVSFSPAMPAFTALVKGCHGFIRWPSLDLHEVGSVMFTLGATLCFKYNKKCY